MFKQKKFSQLHIGTGWRKTRRIWILILGLNGLDAEGERVKQSVELKQLHVHSPWQLHLSVDQLFGDKCWQPMMRKRVAAHR